MAIGYGGATLRQPTTCTCANQRHLDFENIEVCQDLIRMDPVAIAAETLQKDRSVLGPAERIKNGLTNESWVVRTANEGVVVRVGNHSTEPLQIDRRSEAIVLSTVAAAGIGPPVLLCAPDRNLLVTRLLPGHTWTSRDVRTSANVARLAALLRELHALPIPANVRTVDLRLIVSGYWNTLLAKGLGAKVGTQDTRDRARQLIAQLAEDSQVKLCHNDVHHLNIVDGGRLWLLDWEYAGIGDPYFDLASVCCYHAYSDKLRAEFLRAYLGVDKPSSLERLHRMCWVFNYIRDLWFAVREMA
jgi:thiamine kinase